jgi:hypothetical protein
MPAGKFGRLPGTIPVGLHDLTYYVAGRLPKPPAKVAVPVIPAQPDGTPWGVDGNSDYGDCGVAGLNHLLRAIAADTREQETFPAPDQVVSYYLAYTGGQDSGVVLSDFLAHVKQAGFYGHTVAAYAPVSVSDVNTLRFAINAYGAYAGIDVTEGMMQAVQGGGPWTWTLDDLGGAVEGGHCIPLLGFDSSWIYAVSWGQVIRIAWPAWHEMAAEAWAVLAGEEVAAKTDGHGISLAALQADLNRLRN